MRIGEGVVVATGTLVIGTEKRHVSGQVGGGNGLLRRLVALTRSADPSDYAVWCDERLVAVVFGTGSVLVFWRLHAPPCPKPTRDGLHTQGL
jgi:hypothetical protein